MPILVYFLFYGGPNDSSHLVSLLFYDGPTDSAQELVSMLLKYFDVTLT